MSDDRPIPPPPPLPPSPPLRPSPEEPPPLPQDDPSPPESASALAAAEATGKLPLLTRLTDRLNPILVREVNQALNGKALVITASLALLGILLIALFAASRDHVSPRDGRDTFTLAVQVLIPIILFIVPFYGFQSMRSEVGGGTVEHLLMSRLGPGAIVRGKLQASAVQFILYLSIFSPLIGMTFLLRGVDVPTIAVFLTLAFVYALAASSLGIACGALCRWRSIFRVIPFAIVLIGLIWLTVMSMAGVEFGARGIRRQIADPDFFHYLVLMTMPAIGFTILSSMVGSAVLAHPYENRSSKFRLFAIGWLVVGAGWFLNEHRLLAKGSLVGTYSFFDLGEVMGEFVAISASILFLFCLFAATEPNKMSPRVRSRVPRNRWLALLVAPLLPGCGRGLLFTLLLGALGMFLVVFVPAVASAPVAPQLTGAEANWPLAAWLYVFLFSGIACFVRSFLADSDGRNWLARGTFPVLLLGSSILPLLVALFTRERLSRVWSPLHVFNPISTLDSFDRRSQRDEILLTLIALCVIVFLLNVRSMARGVSEVLAASAARRRREKMEDEDEDRAKGVQEAVALTAPFDAQEVQEVQEVQDVQDVQDAEDAAEEGA